MIADCLCYSFRKPSVGLSNDFFAKSVLSREPSLTKSCCNRYSQFKMRTPFAVPRRAVTTPRYAPPPTMDRGVDINAAYLHMHVVTRAYHSNIPANSNRSILLFNNDLSNTVAKHLKLKHWSIFNAATRKNIDIAGQKLRASGSQLRTHHINESSGNFIQSDRSKTAVWSRIS